MTSCGTDVHGHGSVCHGRAQDRCSTPAARPGHPPHNLPEVGKAATVAEQIASISSVTLAEDVTGPYDVIARVEARNVDELGKLVIAKIQDVPGITRTLTCTVVHV